MQKRSKCDSGEASKERRARKEGRRKWKESKSTQRVCVRARVRASVRAVVIKIKFKKKRLNEVTFDLYIRYACSSSYCLGPVQRSSS